MNHSSKIRKNEWRNRFLRYLQKFSRPHWLIFIVNKRTDYISLKRYITDYITVKNSSQNHKRNNKTTAMGIQFISGHMASRHPILSFVPFTKPTTAVLRGYSVTRAPWRVLLATKPSTRMYVYVTSIRIAFSSLPELKSALRTKLANLH